MERNLMNRLYKENQPGCMWNMISKSKLNSTSEYVIDMTTFKDYFSAKLDESTSNSTQNEALSIVTSKYNDIKAICDRTYTFSVYHVKRYIKQLRTGCSPGSLDGVTAEHLLHGLNTV